MPVLRLRLAPASPARARPGIRARLAGAVLLLCLLPTAAPAGPRVSVLVFSDGTPGPAGAAYERSAQAHAEALLGEAGYEVLDEAKAAALRKGWVDMADPSHVVTAEEFAERAGRYDIEQVFRLSVHWSSSPVLGLFHTATAGADLRRVDREARVAAARTDTMGTRGQPPSDGLTEGAAIVNALQRAVDAAFERAGVPVAAPVPPRGVPLALVAGPPLGAGAGDAGPSPPAAPAVPDPVPPWVSAAPLAQERFRGEDLSCVAVSPDGRVGAVGGYTWAIDRLAGMRRSYGGRVHLIDLAASRPFNLYTVHELGQRQAGEDGSSAPLGCQFLGSWRYLLVATGNRVSLYDVERGIEMSSQPLAGGPDALRLTVAGAVTPTGTGTATGPVVRIWTPQGVQQFSLQVARR